MSVCRQLIHILICACVCFRRFLGENEGVGSGLSMFPAHHAQKNRLSYKEELRKQVCPPYSILKVLKNMGVHLSV